MASPPPKPDNVKVKVKTPGKRRRAFGWTLLLLGLLVAGVWGASWLWIVQRAQGNGSTVVVYCGGIDIEAQVGVVPQPPVWYYGLLSDSWRRWRWTAEPQRKQAYLYETWHYGVISRYDLTLPGRGTMRTEWFVVFWPIPFLLCIPGGLLLRSGIIRGGRAERGECAKCGYSLAGLAAEAPCPECGKASNGGGVNASASES